jgi:antitoxin HigA-1
MEKPMARKLAPMHPGEVLREEFLVPLGLSPGALAKACGVPRTRIERIANEETAVTADTALRLGKALGTSAQLWLNLQNEFDMRMAKGQIGKELEKITLIAGMRRRARGPGS